MHLSDLDGSFLESDLRDIAPYSSVSLFRM